MGKNWDEMNLFNTFRQREPSVAFYARKCLQYSNSPYSKACCIGMVPTLRYRIEEQYRINDQGDKFPKN